MANDESTRAVLAEACQHLRHYSNLRFAILGGFLAMNGGIAALMGQGRVIWAGPRLGVVFSLMFAFVEFRVEMLIRRYKELAYDLGESLGVPNANLLGGSKRDGKSFRNVWYWSARMIFLAVYLLIGLSWAVEAGWITTIGR